jgi:coenzyme F420-dependent glucose-6-phosphate dehydrogenase
VSVGGYPHAMQVGYALSSEEHKPRDLIAHAVAAEKAGFPFALISDHFHPWIDRQGESPFVWSVLGGIAASTTDLVVGTGVTCPLLRVHPAVIAQAAATTASLFGGRFFLGVGTGENLNEHIVGHRWPPTALRREMLGEAVEVMRKLWTGELVTHRGPHYTVEDARIYTLPESPFDVCVAAGGPEAAKLAAEIGDGIICTAPDAELLQAFEEADGAGPRYAQVTVCWAKTEKEAIETALEWWPNAGLQGPLGQELPLPSHFEQAAAMVSEGDITEAIACGPDPETHLEKIDAYRTAGFDHIYLHQVGPDQEGFMRFYESTMAAELESLGAASNRA